MNLIFEIDRQRLLDGSTGAPIASLQFSYPDKYPVTISITRGNQPHPVTGNVYVTLKPASAPLSPPLALLTIPVNGSATATGILDTYIQEMDDWLPAANKRAAQFEILVVSTTGGTEVSVDVPAQVSRRYNSVDQPGVTVAEKSLASQAEAEAGTNNTKWMSPLRVAQAISHLAEFADTTDELSEGTENLYFTPARAKAAVASDISIAVDAEAQARAAADSALSDRIEAEANSLNSLQEQVDGKVSNYTDPDFGEQSNVAPAAIVLRDAEEPQFVALRHDGREDGTWTVRSPGEFRTAIGAASETATQAALNNTNSEFELRAEGIENRLSTIEEVELPALASAAQPKNLAASIEVKAVTQGAYSDGTTIPAGTPVEEVLRKMLQTRVPATYAAPTLSISSNFGTQAEIGSSYSGTITVNWQQRDAGNGTNAYLRVNGNQAFYSPSGPAASYNISTRPLTAAESWQFTTGYGPGPQKLDNFGDPSGTPIAAGTISSNTLTITPVRRIFLGASTDTAAPTTNAHIRALATSALNPANGSTYTLTLPAGTRRAVIAYPSTLRALTSVKYVELGNAEVRDTFTESTIQVDGATAGQNATPYRVYTYIAAIPLGAAATYTITL